MTEADYGFIIVLIYHVICALSWRSERTELVNKIMSRSFHDYQFSKNVEKTLRPDGDVAEKIKTEDGFVEDLSPIQEFGMN